MEWNGEWNGIENGMGIVQQWYMFRNEKALDVEVEDKR